MNLQYFKVRNFHSQTLLWSCIFFRQNCPQINHLQYSLKINNTSSLRVKINDFIERLWMKFYIMSQTAKVSGCKHHSAIQFFRCLVKEKINITKHGSQNSAGFNLAKQMCFQPSVRFVWYYLYISKFWSVRVDFLCFTLCVHQLSTIWSFTVLLVEALYNVQTQRTFV